MSVNKKFEQIRAFTASGDLDSACMLARVTIKKHPKDIPIALAYAEALLATGDHAAVADALARFVTSPNAPADVFLMRAYALMQVQQLEEGLRTVIAGLRLHRDHSELLNHAGVLCAELKRPVDAESWFRRLSEVQPQRADAFLGLGNALHEQGESGEALQAYETAIALEPANPSPQVNRANLLAEMGEHDTAQGAYRDTLQRFPQRKDVLSNLAASLAATGDHLGAAKLYNEYLSIHPQDFDAGLSMARALLKSGDAAASKNVLQNMARTRKSFRPRRMCTHATRSSTSLSETTTCRVTKRAMTRTSNLRRLKYPRPTTARTRSGTMCVRRSTRIPACVNRRRKTRPAKASTAATSPRSRLRLPCNN
jgi:Tfp pilus assembly protein PilF